MYILVNNTFYSDSAKYTPAGQKSAWSLSVLPFVTPKQFCKRDYFQMPSPVFWHVWLDYKCYWNCFARDEFQHRKLCAIFYFIKVCTKCAHTMETLYSTIYYSKYFIELNFDKSTQYVALWTHKRHPIPRPFGRAMECLLWVLEQKLIVL